MIRCNHFNQASTSPISALTGNRVTFSDFTNCEMEEYQAATYSIKFVLQGTEHYFLNNKHFAVSGGNFLLVNKQQPLDFFIRSRQKVLGLCIHIEDRMMQDVYTQMLLPEESRLDDPQHGLKVPELEEIIYAEEENDLGKYLKQIAMSYDSSTGTVAVEPTEFYHCLSQNLMLTQNPYLKGTGNLTAIKYSTKKELIRRLELAREMMNVPDVKSVNMETIARQAMLSDAHFFRSFKKQYGVSPYQYLLQQKLERSAQLLQKKEATVADIAFSNGFADTASFSKAFKKHYGLSPKQFVKA